MEKFSQDSEITLRLQVSQSQVTLFYRSLTGLAGVNLNETIPSRIWTHLTVQVTIISYSQILNLLLVYLFINTTGIIKVLSIVFLLDIGIYLN